MNSLKSGIAIATAAAALFSTGLLISPTVQAADGSVKCAGTNSCKGQGWVSSKSAKDCTDAGGKVSK